MFIEADEQAVQAIKALCNVALAARGLDAVVFVQDVMSSVHIKSRTCADSDNNESES